MSDLLNNAASGLMAFRRAIDTTSHNIANARTEGYSRQRVELQARPGEQSLGNDPGRGTEIVGIERLHDAFAAARVLESTSAHAREDTHHALASRIDALVADEALGLGPALSGFYTALEDAAAEPASNAAREAALAEAESLVKRFGTLQTQLDDIGLELEQRTRAELDSLNDLAAGVADLNRRIVSTHGRGSTAQASDLLDRRDGLIEQIASRVDVKPLAREDGSVDLVVGGGTMLVIGERAHTLHLAPGHASPGSPRLEIDTGGGERQPLGTASLGGGLGGLQDFAAETLDPVRRRLGRIAQVTAERMNEQHARGLDADGQPGGKLFDIGPPRAVSGSANTGTATLGVEITDATALAASDYLLRWDGAAFEVTRESDGTRTSAASPIALDGLEITIDGAPAVGDTFRVSATAHAAGTLSLVATRPESLALARTLVATGDVANTGDATLAQPTVRNVADPALRTPVDIVFTADDTYDVVERGGGDALATGLSYVPGEEIAFNGWSSSLEGRPRAGDVHRIDLNTDGHGDNGNALALVERREEPAVGGTETLHDAHAEIVAFVGSRTRTLETRSGALETLRDDASARAEAVSGVDLDEEAIALTRYEQAYQASARVVAVADTLFQSILGAIR